MNDVSDPTRFINQMVEVLLPRFSPPNLGLLFTLEGDGSILGSHGRGDLCPAPKGLEDWKEQRKYAVHSIERILFVRSGNNVKVFRQRYDVEKLVRGFLPQLSKDQSSTWEKWCDHDSCWRSDGTERVVFRMVWGLMEKLKIALEKDYPKLADEIYPRHPHVNLEIELSYNSISGGNEHPTLVTWEDSAPAGVIEEKMVSRELREFRGMTPLNNMIDWNSHPFFGKDKQK
jgi:hypothetical protein